MQVESHNMEYAVPSMSLVQTRRVKKGGLYKVTSNFFSTDLFAATEDGGKLILTAQEQVPKSANDQTFIMFTGNVLSVEAIKQAYCSPVVYRREEGFWAMSPISPMVSFLHGEVELYTFELLLPYLIEWKPDEE